MVWRHRAFDVSAAALHIYYVDKTRSAEQQHGGVAEGTVGPVESYIRLQF